MEVTPSTKNSVTCLESPPLPVKGVDAVPESVSLEASKNNEDKVQTNEEHAVCPKWQPELLESRAPDDTTKAVTFQSVVLGIIVPRVNDARRDAVLQQFGPDVCVAVTVAPKISPVDGTIEFA